MRLCFNLLQHSLRIAEKGKKDAINQKDVAINQMYVDSVCLDTCILYTLSDKIYTFILHTYLWDVGSR